MTDMSNISEATRARINQRDIQPGNMEEAISLYRTNVIPEFGALQGSIDGILLTNNDANKLVAVSLWSSNDAMLESIPPNDPNNVSAGPVNRYYSDVVYAYMS